MPATPEQDQEMWKLYSRGRRQYDIAKQFNITQQAVSAAIARHRTTIPDETRDEILKREIDLFTSLRDEVLELWHNTTGAPVTAGKDGKIVTDPETGQIVRDHTGRLSALRAAREMGERLARLTGIDAAVRIDLSASEDAETRAQAAEALSRLHGGGTGDD
jgi:hypothetical protein